MLSTNLYNFCCFPMIMLRLIFTSFFMFFMHYMKTKKKNAEDTSKCSLLCGLKSCFKSVFQYKPYNTAFLAPSTFTHIE